jgi:hypothetical protein
VPITDNDTVHVYSAQIVTVDGVNVGRIDWEWFDAAGVSRGRQTSELKQEELWGLLDTQDHDDVLRSLLGGCVDRETQQIKPAVFLALDGNVPQGKRWRILQRVQAV